MSMGRVRVAKKEHTMRKNIKKNIFVLSKLYITVRLNVGFPKSDALMQAAPRETEKTCLRTDGSMVGQLYTYIQSLHN